MKNNIDLTENRIFSEKASLRTHMLEALLSKLPWEKYIMLVESDDDLDLERQRISIIATGNRSERARIKFYRQMNDANYCDCCGAAMNKKPWYMEIGVCRKCDDYYNRKIGHPWGEDEIINEIIQSSPILNI